ncbi:MAG: hypothetical protein ACK5OB_15285 [Pirellula sp.]
MLRLGVLAIVFALVAAPQYWVCGQDAVETQKVYSGQQVGEPLSPFSMRVAIGPMVGKEMDLLDRAGNGPLVVIFVHDVNRQSVALTRIASRYAASRAKDGLTAGVVLLDDDLTKGEATLNRIQHALIPRVPTGVSLDGGEGPGAYGLNRKVQLTVLVAKEKQVTANFAIVQPSLQVDLPQIVAAIVEQVGGTAPELKDLLAQEPAMLRSDESKRGAVEMRRPEGPRSADINMELRPLVRPLIQPDASEEDVDRAAQAILVEVEKREAIRNEIGRIATTIVQSGKLANYGTPRAQEYLQKWAEAYGPTAQSPKVDAVKDEPGLP